MADGDSPPRRAAVVYDSLFPITIGGGERVYRRMAELLNERGVITDYVTREFDDADIEGVTVVGVWRGEIYDDAGRRTTGGAIRFALAVFRYFRSHRGSYALVVASALPVLTVLAVRLALVGTTTRVVADWLEVWSAAKWRAYAGTLSGSLAWVLQWVGARTIHEHTVNSRFTAARLARYARKARVLDLGLMDLVEPGAPSAAADPPMMLFVGRLIADKGVVEVPAAMALARQRVPELHAGVIGEGPERGRLEAAIAAHGLEDVFRLLGRVDEATLTRVRAEAAVLVAPSVREGFGLAVAEASAWGIPAVVVAHEDNAAKDLIDEGVNGFVVAPDDPDALAAGIVRAVLAGPELRRSSAAWFRDARGSRTIAAAVDELLRER